MKHTGRLIAIGFGCLVVFLTLPMVFVWHAFGSSNANVTSRWRETFREEASYFWIPQEAKLVHAEERQEFMGGGFLVVFALPETKLPIEWLELMATKSKLNACRKSRLMFDCEGDINRLEYIPARKVFEAEHMWD
ncbi:MAG: hypothetical protein H7Y17_07590 [Chlorobia bacterium]|nr:hypothetical protein [Fimbriimonadaceae bacterium]